MPGARRRNDKESFESIFRRFKKAVEKDGTLQEVRDREFYVKPSIKRKRAKAAAVKRCKRELIEERNKITQGKKNRRNRRGQRSKNTDNK